MAKLIGNGPNQVPTNGDLGTMAFEDKKNYATREEANVVGSTQLKDSVSLQILDSSGTVVKTIYGAGS